MAVPLWIDQRTTTVTRLQGIVGVPFLIPFHLLRLRGARRVGRTNGQAIHARLGRSPIGLPEPPGVRRFGPTSSAGAHETPPSALNSTERTEPLPGATHSRPRAPAARPAKSEPSTGREISELT